MRCPFCGNKEDRVIDSRSSDKGGSVRRRRECEKCNRRFTTYETVEQTPLMIVKKDGRREAFDRNKILSGIVKSCEKRPISIQKIDSIVDKIEKEVRRNFDKEIPSDVIGEFIMDHLHKLDQVAYVRFASVYREFKDINHFMRELKGILHKKK